MIKVYERQYIMDRMEVGMRKIVLIFILLLSLYGCETITENPIEHVEPLIVVEEPQFDSLIFDIMATKLEAIELRDFELYMSTVSDSNEYYVNEQGRWFREMTKDEISDISFDIESVNMIDEVTAVANIRQKHEASTSIDISYPLLFKFENNGWKDCGYNFDVKNTDRFSVKYMKGESKVEAFTSYLNAAYDNIEKVFDEKADTNFELKLFNDQELLRQRTVPSITWLFTGWAEPDESLKIYTGHSYDRYPGILQHELTHHITIKICNNNLSAWILEGVAMYYGSIAVERETYGEIRPMDKKDMFKDIEYLETLDLYNVQGKIVGDWYNSSYMYVRYIIDTYGHDTLMDIFYEAGKKPFNSSVLNENFDMNNIQTTDEALETVLGLSKSQLSEAYFLWLDAMEIID